MALVEINAIDYTFNRLVDRRIFKDYISSFTSKLQCYFFVASGNRPLDDFSNFSGTRECDFVYVWMVYDCSTGGTSARHNIYYSRREPGFLYYFCKLQGSK